MPTTKRHPVARRVREPGASLRRPSHRKEPAHGPSHPSYRGALLHAHRHRGHHRPRRRFSRSARPLPPSTVPPWPRRRALPECTGVPTPAAGRWHWHGRPNSAPRSPPPSVVEQPALHLRPSRCKPQLRHPLQRRRRLRLAEVLHRGRSRVRPSDRASAQRRPRRRDVPDLSRAAARVCGHVGSDRSARTPDSSVGGPSAVSAPGADVPPATLRARGKIRISTFLRRSLPVACELPDARPCTVRLSYRGRTLGKGTGESPAGGANRFTVRPLTSGRRYLRQTRRGAVRATLTVIASDGRPTYRAITLRR